MRILFISGYVRSGSTLLSLLLGDMNRCFSVGEMSAMVYGPNTSLDDLCLCGHAFRECEFWCKVWQVAFPGVGQKARGELCGLLGREAVSRSRYLAGTLLPASLLGSEREAALRRMVRLYEAAAETAQRDVLIDSSKTPVHAFMLLAGGVKDLRPIHLVRNPCAVVFSQARVKERREKISGRTLLPRRSLLRAVAGWTRANIDAERLSRACSRSAWLRYEDLVASPEVSVSNVLRLADFPVGAPLVPRALEQRATRPASRHDVAGNPSKFQWRGSGQDVKPDLEWETTMPALSRYLVTALTYPWMRRYGYLSVDRE